LGFCILNREALEDRKEIILAHLAAEQLDLEGLTHQGWNPAHDLA
jgi:hypothetical protein